LAAQSISDLKKTRVDKTLIINFSIGLSSKFDDFGQLAKGRLPMICMIILMKKSKRSNGYYCGEKQSYVCKILKINLNVDF
jgi:hypothetical protein